MTKRELLDMIGRRGVKDKLAAKRIGDSKELHDLPDDAEITACTVEQWIEESPWLTGELHATGSHPHLSESDLRLVARNVQRIIGRRT